jgi:type I restriction enzyme, S subunit
MTSTIPSNVTDKKLHPNWQLVPVKDVIHTVSLAGKKLPQSEFQKTGKYPVIDQGQNFIGGYTNSAELLVNTELPVIVFGDHTKTIKFVDFPFVAGADGIKVIRPISNIDPKAFYYLLQTIKLPNTGYARNFQALEKSVVPIPPLDEQRRIASRLNEQLAAVESARQAAEEQLQAAQELPSAYFSEAFQGITPLSASVQHDKAPKGWSWKKLTTIARLESGHTPSRYHAEWWGGSIPWIALPDIRALDGKVAYETSEYTNEHGIANSSARILPPGTVCISRTASVGFVTIMGREMSTSQDFFDWVCGPEIDPFFLMYLFLASRDYFRSISSGAIHKTVYMPTAKVLEVCIPLIDEQKRVVSFLKEKLFSSEELVTDLQSQLDEINRLPASLLREAFAADLIP